MSSPIWVGKVVKPGDPSVSTMRSIFGAVARTGPSISDVISSAVFTVRVTCGESRDREGTLVGLAGPRRWPGGIYAPGGFVEVATADGARERICVPLSTLERLG